MSILETLRASCLRVANHKIVQHAQNGVISRSIFNSSAKAVLTEHELLFSPISAAAAQMTLTKRFTT